MTSNLAKEELLQRVKELKFQRILNIDTKSKSINILGCIQDQLAILILEKTAFDLERIDLNHITDYILDGKLIQNNDVFHWYLNTFQQSLETLPSIKTTLIWPASENHIKKYSTQPKRMIVETPDMYERLTQPFILTQRGSQIQWVHNILDHKAESDRIVLEDPDRENGYIILPDLKWDRQNMLAFNVMAISHSHEIASIRDLKPKHLGMLRNLRESVLKKIPTIFPVEASQLKLFVHYPPSYYHFHVHIMHVDHETGEGSAVGRAILLDDIIERLQLLGPEGFASANLTFSVGTQNPLYTIFAGDESHQ
ncbi:m7G(5')pppN diphosphatase [Schizosaccharomyces japonicus yFS275]|uniref:m7GpppX diphosphatase n=1 Tax=Schizosaccharomyces japonicus (strain yFS275 / FY16936) TaxID=402676 RepID=B6JYG3_SCHJY|nr:m7G(5')pppN diphosphatase [Schizosaccharomyces japonicus yFS275]EEB06581.1 m7G(5')pppN diphosphatase [Schizosaccharomyces japonicus yFS275]